MTAPLQDSLNHVNYNSFIEYIYNLNDIQSVQKTLNNKQSINQSVQIIIVLT